MLLESLNDRSKPVLSIVTGCSPTDVTMSMFDCKVRRNLQIPRSILKDDMTMCIETRIAFESTSFPNALG
jgi:hypothetical protein